MGASVKNNFLNVTYRSFTIVIKGLFSFFLAKEFSPSIIGTYSLYLYWVFTFLTIAGFELQWITTRECLSENTKNNDKFLFSHIVIVLSMFCFIVIPVFIGMCSFGYIPLSIALLLFMLLVCEFICQQWHHFLIATHQSTRANKYILLRSVSWMPIIFILHSLYEINENDIVRVNILAFFITDMLIVVFIWLINRKFIKNIIDQKLNLKSINFVFLKKKFKSASYLFLSLIILIFSENIVRLFIDTKFSRDMLGVYTFFLTACQAIESLVVAGVISVTYPKLNEIADDLALLQSGLKKLKFQSFIISIILFFVLITMFFFFLKEINMVYYQNIKLFYIMSLYFVVKIIESISNIGLILVKKERFIWIVNFGILVLLVLELMFLSLFNKTTIVNIALLLLVNYSLSLFIKYLLYRKKNETLYN